MVDGRDDDRRRDEPGGREVVARPEPEREHDQRDDDETREDPPRARPQLPLPVEARLCEHEDRDRRGELEPLGRALAPQQAPEDVAVAGDHLAQDEREVDPEREPDDVEHDERRDGEHAPDDATRSARARAGTGARLEHRAPLRPASGSASDATSPPAERACRTCRGSLEPSHVVPRDARRIGERSRARARRGRARRPDARARGDARVQKRTPTAVEEIGVVEVDVDEAWQRPPRERASEVAERVRRRDRAELAARRKLDARRRRSATPSARPLRGTADVTPAACSRRSRAPRTPRRPRRPSTSRRRRTASGAMPRSRRASPSSRTPGAGRSSPVGRAWSGAVQCVWCPSGPRAGGLAGAREPASPRPHREPRPAVA